MRAGATKTTTKSRTRAARLGGGLLSALMLVLLTLASPARAALPTPTVTTIASATAALVGGSISDTAVVTGGAKPTGTVTFSLYGDSKCASTPVFTQTVPLAPGLTGSGAYTPTAAGTYIWVASYSGDAANNPAKGACGDPAETVVVTAPTPKITTAASPGVALGGAVNDSIVLTGGYKPTGTVTFRLYGPGDPNCTGAPVFTSTVGVTTPTVSGAYRPTAAGTYHWVATYNGDPANNGSSGACGDPGESVVVGGSGSGSRPGPGGPPPAACDGGAMAKALVNSLVAALTGGAGSGFKAACSAGVRIVLRAKEIRPGNPGFPRHDGFTTMANTLTHTTSAGQVAFSLNAQGVALHGYAKSKGTSLVVFAIVHIRPDRTTTSAEAIQIFNLT